MNRRVVITGLGIVSSIGIGKDEFWSNLIQGKSGISKISSIDTSNYPIHYGGEVRNFKPESFIKSRKIDFLGRASQFAISASGLAVKDAKLKIKDNIGLAIGTTMGEIQLLENIDDFWVDNKLDNVKKNSISPCRVGRV